MFDLDRDIEAYKDRLEWLLADSKRLTDSLVHNTKKMKTICEKLEELTKQKEENENGLQGH